MQLRDGLLQVDEELMTVLDVVDRLTELVLVALDLKWNAADIESMWPHLVNH